MLNRDDESANPGYFERRAKGIWKTFNGRIKPEQIDLDFINLVEFERKNKEKLRQFKIYLENKDYSNKEYEQMLLKLAPYVYRIGDLENKNQQFERQRRDNLAESEDAYGEVDQENFTNQALDNYAIFYYKWEQKISKIQTENLTKLCFALNLLPHQDKILDDLNRLKPKILRDKEIKLAKPPKRLTKKVANQLTKEIQDFTRIFEPKVLQELERRLLRDDQ